VTETTSDTTSRLAPTYWQYWLRLLATVSACASEMAGAVPSTASSLREPAGRQGEVREATAGLRGPTETLQGAKLAAASASLKLWFGLAHAPRCTCQPGPLLTFVRHNDGIHDPAQRQTRCKCIALLAWRAVLHDAGPTSQTPLAGHTHMPGFRFRRRMLASGRGDALMRVRVPIPASCWAWIPA
jgi:hypothetical protein